MELKLMNSAVETSIRNGEITMVAPERCDCFVNPLNGEATFNAPFYHLTQTGDFVANVHVTPGFGDRYDAGALMVYETKSKWFKFAFEMTDLGYASAVSVVTDGVSDDANGEPILTSSAWLQIARHGDAWGLHYRIDNPSGGRAPAASAGTGHWKTVRVFGLPMSAEVKVGLVAQSPVGSGCRVVFTGFEVKDYALGDLRRGE